MAEEAKARAALTDAAYLDEVMAYHQQKTRVKQAGEGLNARKLTDYSEGAVPENLAADLTSKFDIPAEEAKEIVKSNPKAAMVYAKANISNGESTMTKETVSLLASLLTPATSLDISNVVKWGKSGKIFKSLKIPKFLIAPIRAIKPPSAAMFLLSFLNFIWRLVSPAMRSPPGEFLRYGMMYFRALGRIIPGKAIDKDDLATILVAFSKTDSGTLLNAFAAYREMSAAEKQKLIKARGDKKIARDALILAGKNFISEAKEDTFAAVTSAATSVLTDTAKSKEVNLTTLLTNVNPAKTVRKSAKRMTGEIKKVELKGGLTKKLAGGDVAMGVI